MANINGANDRMLQRMNNANTPARAETGIKGLLSSIDVKKRFEEILGKKAAGFMSSIINVTNNNTLLQKAEPKSILAAAAVAASLDLPIDPNLGFAYIVPYNSKDGSKGQFQLGYKGYVQLAMRTGMYKTINTSEVYEGEIQSINRFTGEIEFGEKTADKIVGYIAYFKLINGFEKYLYMTVEEIQKHAQKFSKSIKRENSLWNTDFHAMALKTVLRRLLSKFGILSIEMQSGLSTALQADQAVVSEDENGEFNYDYIDAEGRTVEEEGAFGPDADNIPVPEPVPGEVVNA